MFPSIPNFFLGFQPSEIPLTFTWIAFQFSTHRHSILSALNFHVGPQKFQKYYLFSTGPRRYLDWRGITRSGIGALRVPFLVKLTKIPLVNPGLTKSQSWSKSPQNDIFHISTSNPSNLVIFVNFDQVCEGKSGFVSQTKLTAEATFMDLFHSWLITCTMWFWEFENKIAYLGAVKLKTKD